jgi:hypothetical protein
MHQPIKFDFIAKATFRIEVWFHAKSQFGKGRPPQAPGTIDK